MKRWRTTLVGLAAATAVQCGGTTDATDGGDVDATIADAANDVPNADGGDAIITAPCGDAGDAALCNVATEYCAIDGGGVVAWQSGPSSTCATPADGAAPSCAGDGCGIPVDAGGCPWCDDAGNVIPPLPLDGSTPWPNCGVCDKSPTTGLVTWMTCASV